MVTLNRLYPLSGSVTAAEAVAELDFGAGAPSHRPHIALNMVSSADGQVTLDGRSGGLSSPADRELFHALRTAVDGVLVGAGTVRVEGYGALVRDRQLREARVARGLAPRPVAVIASASLNIRPDVPLLADPGSRVIILTSSPHVIEGAAAHVEYVRMPAEGRLDLPAALRVLREQGVRSLLCEGGPRLTASLLPAGLVDELFLSIAPVLVGGGLTTMISVAAALRPVDLELRWLLESEGHLFARYGLRR